VDELDRDERYATTPAAAPQARGRQPRVPTVWLRAGPAQEQQQAGHARFVSHCHPDSHLLGDSPGCLCWPGYPGATGASGAAVDSPKRKRGRPKGSGKKAKARLEAGAGGVPLGGQGSGFKGLEHSESSVFLQAGGSSPSLVLGYDSQSPGSSSALTNSPTSMWSAGAARPLHLADLLDISGESSGHPGASGASPATPSSSTSNMLRSFSTASSAGSAMLPVPEDGARSGLPLVSPRTSARSARLNSGTHARRLMFGVEEEVPEAAPSPAPAAPAAAPNAKKSSKGKTGRPRGRPRHIRPHERVRPAGEQV